MSFSLGGNSDIENGSDAQYNRARKSYNRMDFQDKIQIIAAVEKGQTKVDIGREFGIHPRTVTYIYKQKDAVLKKCKQKMSSEGECTVDVNLCLLNWFILQTQAYCTVTEDDAKNRAEEIAHTSDKEDFRFTKAWFNSFKKTHNIVKHMTNVEGAPEKGECRKWAKLIERYETYSEDDIYIGGTCGLLHKDNLQNYQSRHLNIDEFVSLLLITNIAGSDKHKLVAAGSDIPHTAAQTLPLQYFYKDNAQMDKFILAKVLQEWDNELKVLDRKILLIFHLAESCLPHDLQLEQIKVVHLSDIVYISKTFERIVKCFKYHYRKLQIMQSFSFRKEGAEFVDHMRMLSLAWHSVSGGTINHIFHPRYRSCLYFSSLDKHFAENEENDRFSLTEWCESHCIPLKLENNDLDGFVACDRNITSIEVAANETAVPYTATMTEWFTNSEVPTPVSAIDAFQATKRLLRYMQSEEGPNQSLKSIKQLEDQLEYEMCMELQQNIGTNSMEN